MSVDFDSQSNLPYGSIQCFSGGTLNVTKFEYSYSGGFCNLTCPEFNSSSVACQNVQLLQTACNGKVKCYFNNTGIAIPPETCDGQSRAEDMIANYNCISSGKSVQPLLKAFRVLFKKLPRF